uniref:G-protein coupled receptors family 2 profile 2 domain-containing protein n=1 Tax=Pygocentrus nattereri TaxID=42514 RepID=A0A3B4CBR3_PYGNA
MAIKPKSMETWLQLLMSKAVMMVIAFFLGYGAPLLIAVITVASTAGGGGYIQEENACWLNWNKTKAMLAFVIPALTIVAINFLVLLVVVCKMISRGVGNVSEPDEKNAIVVIARCVAILTPLFGLTWAFGIGTMVSSALGIHIVFAILNSLQSICFSDTSPLISPLLPCSSVVRTPWTLTEQVLFGWWIILSTAVTLQSMGVLTTEEQGKRGLTKYQRNRWTTVCNCRATKCSYTVSGADKMDSETRR